MKKVVIIGAGPAGLAAAFRFITSKEQYSITILEADSQVGGIAKTISYGNYRMDLGGHRFFTKDEEIERIWFSLVPLQGEPISSELEPEQKLEYSGNADPNIEDEVFLNRRRVSRIYYNNKFFDYPIRFNLDTLRKLGFKQVIQCSFSYISALIFKRRGKSLEDFYINRFGKKLYKMFFEDYTTKLWGIHPSKLDSSWGAQRVKKLSVVKMLLENIKKKICRKYVTDESSLIETFYYPKYGPGQLWDKMQRELEEKGVKILFNAKCNKILCKENTILGVQYENENHEYCELKCDYVISSIPIKNLINSMEAKVPSDVRALAKELPYRDFITVGVLVKKLKIVNETTYETFHSLPPDCWIYIQDKRVHMGRVQIFNNWSPYLVHIPDNTVWLGVEYFCSDTEQMWNCSEEEFVSMALEELEQIGLIDKKDVLDATRVKVKKAYPAYYGVYKEFEKIKQYLLSYQNLYCIGRNGQHRYNNMDHSMLTGIKAADAIMHGLGNKTIWDVNTEESYHENKTD